MAERFPTYKQIKISLACEMRKTLRLYSVYEDETHLAFEKIDSTADFDIFGVLSDSSGDSYKEKLFEYNANATGVFEKLRLYETKNYYCKYENLSVSVQNEKELAPVQSGENQFSFKVVNYLGKSAFNFESAGKTFHLPFEIIPLKIDYEDDYVQLTDDIADFCSQLLLDYASPVNLNFSHNPTDFQKSPLEMFIFIRKFCSSQNIEYLMQCIKANPDRMLVSENELKPFGTAPVSNKFFTNPFSNANRWQKMPDGTYLPEKIASVRKYDSYNTSANQFIQFAFGAFIQVCQNVIDRLENDSSYKDEAVYLKQVLENILSDSFFDDVQNLSVLPFNNSVLQKREGYIQIFNAFNMLDVAQQLDWEGQEKVYEGQARNIALLYEYWLVFKLLGILKNLGAEFDFDIKKEAKVNQLISLENGLLISLKEGKTSLISALLKDKNLKINFYYNRTFSKKEFDGTDYQGSYSRDFRPDYTISIFPALYDEKQAIMAGEVSFIHFDAKYRVTDITSLFGKDSQKDEDFDDEKKAEAVNTYNRGDLLKMHTYNDAIRKTIGSYVLYPGTSDEANTFAVYDELLPGVGAFAIRPGDKDRAGEKQIEAFLKDVILFKSHVSSRQYRKDFFDNIVIKSPRSSSEKENMPRYEQKKSEYVICGMLRWDYVNHLNKNHFLPKSASDKDYRLCGAEKELYFYYHAIKNNVVYALHPNTSNAKYFCGSQSHFGKTAMLKLEDWTADIAKSELVSAEQLQARLKENSGYNHENPQADFYYLVTLKNIRWHGLEIAGTEYHASQNVGNLAASPYSPKIIEMVQG